MKLTIILAVIAAIMFFTTGCGPGQPFEIESMHTPQSELSEHVVSAEDVPIVEQI